jgi:hypothetical membrane protein
MRPIGTIAGADSRYRRFGASALILGPAQFLVVHVIVQFAWPEPYSWTANAISDLGAVGCGPWPGDGRYVCSPLHDWMNASFILLGLLFVAGLALIGLFRRSGLSWPSRVFLLLAGIGFVLAGLSPADVSGETHILAALIIFFCGNLGLLYVERSGQIVKSLAVRPDGLTLGAIGLVATALLLGQIYFVFGLGGMERLAVFPLLIWAALIGVGMLRAPAKDPAASAT